MLDNQIKEKSTINVISGGDKPEVWKVEPSETAKNCRNFIREIVDNLDLQPNPEKPVIALSIGTLKLYKSAEMHVESILHHFLKLEYL